MNCSGLTDDEVSTWTAALRSDEYIQGRGAMCRETPREICWCPLGVLVNEIWEGDWVLSSGGYLWGIEAAGLWCIRPPESVAKVSTGVMDHIIARNDQSGWSFREIADWIECHREEFTKGTA